MGEQRRRKPLLRMLQVAALAMVAGLLALLAWRIVDAGRGARLVSEVRAGKKPLAPQFRLPVLWRRPDTWPRPRAVRSLTERCLSASSGVSRSRSTFGPPGAPLALPRRRAFGPPLARTEDRWG